MSFYQQLQSATSTSQQLLMSAPVINACRQGTITGDMYIAFLIQIYHHVSYSVPLLMAASGRVPQHQEWVRQAIVRYIDAEYGYKASLLDTIRACGVETDTWRQRASAQWIELMAAYFYDQIQRGNPMSIFGLMHVLESIHMHIAPNIAGQVATEQSSDATHQPHSPDHSDQTLPPCCAELMDNINDVADQAAIIHAAHVVYRLYGDMLHSFTEH
ncbi:iron-containing redox enzyme family protein [Dickeya sp. CFBP 2040]|uniref:iron-containing redox enzyme family protein n=1 Tax=Dickeya sp. CFBP 2040 TaxID=2718531 RepID=UPI001445C4BE|nr:iron-containing redox enzyme family protein [Dickeya sp. CFBP 2040]NKI75053.1 iron-containing redox enzyme family protein [Dickeya sp. CFBP 2040]